MTFSSHFFLAMSRKIKPYTQQQTPSPNRQSTLTSILVPPFLASAGHWLLPAASLSVPLALCPKAQSGNESILSNITALKYSSLKIICPLHSSIHSSTLSIIHSFFLAALTPNDTSLLIPRLHCCHHPPYCGVLLILHKRSLLLIQLTTSGFRPSVFYTSEISLHIVPAFTPQGRTSEPLYFAYEWSEDLVLWMRSFSLNLTSHWLTEEKKGAFITSRLESWMGGKKNTFGHDLVSERSYAQTRVMIMWVNDAIGYSFPEIVWWFVSIDNVKNATDLFPIFCAS